MWKKHSSLFCISASGEENIKTDREKIARGKHSSLFCISASDEKNIRLDRGKFAREKHSSLFCISPNNEENRIRQGHFCEGETL